MTIFPSSYLCRLRKPEKEVSLGPILEVHYIQFFSFLYEPSFLRGMEQKMFDPVSIITSEKRSERKTKESEFAAISDDD